VRAKRALNIGELYIQLKHIQFFLQARTYIQRARGTAFQQSQGVAHAGKPKIRGLEQD